MPGVSIKDLEAANSEKKNTESRCSKCDLCLSASSWTVTGVLAAYGHVVAAAIFGTIGLLTCCRGTTCCLQARSYFKDCCSRTINSEKEKLILENVTGHANQHSLKN